VYAVQSVEGGKMSIPSPNYTQVPNALFKLMPDMEKSELKVVLAVCRQTIGWHKTKDRLTVTLLMTLTGLSRQAVYDGIEEAKKRGILIQEETKQDGFIYSLDIQDPVSNEETLSVQPLDTQKKEKETNNNKTLSSMDSLQAGCWQELATLLVTYSPITVENFCDVWSRHPDIRRHKFALEQTRIYANPVSFRYYETTYLRYDPDKVKPTHSKQARPAAPVNGKSWDQMVIYD
jgi:phage replication O-like protein O